MLYPLPETLLLVLCGVMNALPGDLFAKLRGKSIGTIKAQSNSVFRKAGVSGRAQLVGLLIEDIAEGIGAPPED